uniref:Claudin n=1 Tax=Anabas testudineus TaxID=64144 RepID=A0A7N6BVM6_ANATE
MVEGVLEIAAVCVGLIGLIGAAATTGLPMWKVTAFIEENIIVMETRWEGLWMNCYRQANIRMQCKVYDSLLFLPPELQAARGLMCCSVALSALGLLVALLMACICVFIPVSWTGHVIIRDFYNPLLISAQKRELGEALYIGWVTGVILFASAILFLCRHLPSDKGSFDAYHRANLLSYKPASRKPTLMTYHPISNVSSLRSTAHQPSLHNNGSVGQPAIPLQNIPQVITNDGTPINFRAYNPDLPENVSLLNQVGMGHHSSMHSSNHLESLYAPGNSLYISPNSTPHSLIYTANPPASYQSSFHPVPHTPVFIQYKSSRIRPESDSGSSVGVYI